MDIKPQKIKKNTLRKTSSDSDDENLFSLSCPTSSTGFWRDQNHFSTHHQSSSSKINKQHKTFVLGISGGQASGKTTVCDMVKAKLANRVGVIQLSSFYKPLSEEDLNHVEDYNFEHPIAFDWELLAAQMKLLLNGKTAFIPEWNSESHARLPNPVALSGALIDIIIIEGGLVFHEETIRNMIDMKVFVDDDSDTRLSRKVKRDVVEGNQNLDTILKNYERFVKPCFDLYIQPSKKHADVVLPRGPANEIAVGLLVLNLKNPMTLNPIKF
jgi:uridine kinase